MSEERELTPDELQKLDEQGVDSSQYAGKKVTVLTDDEVANQQASVPTNQVAKPAMSSLQAMGKTLKAHAGGDIGGGVGSLGTGALLTELGLAPFTEGMSLLPSALSLAGIAGVGVGTGYLGQKAQEKVEGPEVAQKLEEEAQQASEQHPIASTLADVGTSALAGGGKPSISNLIKAGGLDSQALKKIAMAGVVNPAINVGINAATTGQLPSAGELGRNAAISSLFSEGAGWANRFHAHGEQSGSDNTGEPIESQPGGTDTPQPQTVDKQPAPIEQPKQSIEQQPQVTTPAQSSLGDITQHPLYRNTSDLAPIPEQIAERDAAGKVATAQLNASLKGQTESTDTAPTTQEETPEDLQSQLQEEQSKNAPSDMDKEGYNQQYAKLLDMMKNGKAGTPEFQDEWKKLEDINNQNKGMPPEGSVNDQTTPIEGQDLNNFIKFKNHFIDNASLYLDRQDPRLDKAEGSKQQLLQKAPEQYKDLIKSSDFSTLDGVNRFKELINDRINKDLGITKNAPTVNLSEPQARLDNYVKYSKDEGYTIPFSDDELKSVIQKLHDNFVNSLSKHYDDIGLTKEQVKFLRSAGIVDAQVNHPPYQVSPNFEISKTKNAPSSDQTQSPYKNLNNLMDIPLGNHIDSGKATVGSALDILSKGQSDYAPLAQHLLENSSPEKLTVPIKTYGDRSGYYPEDKRIGLNKELKHQYNPSVVMEEVAHTTTSNNLPAEFEGLRGEALKTKMDSYLQDPQSNPHVKELINSYFETAKNLGLHDQLFTDRGVTNSSGLKGYKRGLAGKPDSTKLIHEHGYAMGDLHEFTAHLMQDSSFQKTLNEMPSGLKDGNSMWSRILSSIKGILGLDVKSGSLLERALKSANELVGQKGTEDYSSNGGKEVEKNAPSTTPNGQSPEEETNRLGKFGRLFESTIDRVKDIGSPEAKYVAGKLQEAHQAKDENYGKTFNKLKSLADKIGLTKQDEAQLQKISEYENVNGDKAPSTMFRNARQKQMYTLERQVYDQNGKDRIAANEPVYRGDQPTPLVQDPTSHPLTPDSSVIQTYKDNSNQTAISKLDKTFLDYQINKVGLSAKDAQDKLQSFKNAIQGDASPKATNMAFYNAARRAQGITLPPEFTKQGYMNNLESYYSRMALDNASYKHLESDPKVLGALGVDKDAWGKAVPQSPNGSISNNQAVQSALKEFQGRNVSLASRNEAALSSVATSLFISNPAIELHKLGSNIIGAASLGSNPVESLKIMGGMISNFTKGLTHAQENGVTKLTARSAVDMLNSTLTGSERLQALSKGFKSISTLGDLTTKWADGLLQAGAEYALPNKIAKANAGDVTSQQLLKKIDPNYTVGKTYNPQEISKLASSLSGFLHGTHDGRTMPPWMTGDTELAGFFKLAHWSIAQTNKFMSDVYTPATKGDLKPLLNGMFGAAIGGYLIKDLREKIQGKDGQIPSLSEIAASKEGLEGNKNLVAYNMIAGLQYAGFGGILSQVAKYPFDVMHKNSPQGATFPLDEITTDLGKTLGQVSGAMANDPNLNWLDLAKHIGAHVLTTDIELARVGYNNAINAGLVTGDLAEKKALSDKLGELRRFNMVSGYPYEDNTPSNDNPYMNLEQKGYKRTQDIDEAAGKLPGIIDNLIQTYGDKPDVLAGKLKALKENNYETLPSPQEHPNQLNDYLDYLKKEKGADYANSALEDYLKHKALNKAKSAMVP